MAVIEHLTLDLPAGPCDAVLARPDAPGEHPPVLMLMDVFGLRERLEQMAARVADAGYTVIAPNTLYRAGRPPLFTSDQLADGAARMARMGELLGALDAQAWEQEAPALLDEVARRCGSDAPVRVVGYCMGGRLGLLLAATAPQRVACVAGAHVGGLVTDSPDSPHARLAEVRCPVYLGHADADRSMPPQAQGALAEAAGEAHLDYTGALYPGAAHGYTMADRPDYDAAADARFHAAALDLFARV